MANVDIYAEIGHVATQALACLRDHRLGESFRNRLVDVLTVYKAVRIGETIGQTRGWHVVPTGNGQWAVQTVDPHDNDLEALIRSARTHRVACDEHGVLVDAEGDIIQLEADDA